MMSQSQIIELADEQAARAAKEGKTVYAMWQEDIDMLKKGVLTAIKHIPNLGSYVPPGFELSEDTYFVDKSGFGRPDEPALTIEQFINQVVPGYYGIIEEGEFQLVIGKFDRIKKSVTG